MMMNAVNEDRVVKAATYLNPAEAHAASAFLKDQGIESKVIGDFTSNFLVEIAGEIQVLVSQPQLERSRDLLTKLEASENAVDWSKVDVGDSTPIGDDESPGLAETVNPSKPKRFQYDLFTLLRVQTAIAIGVAALVALSGLDLKVALAIVVFPAACAALFLGITTATTYMAKNMSRDVTKKFIIAGTLLYLLCFAFGVLGWLRF